MAKRLRLLTLLIPICAAFASWSTTSPGVDLKRWSRFPLEKFRVGAAFDGIEAHPVPMERDLVLKGRAGAKRWEAHLCDGCAAFAARGDLDGNGVPDYVFTGAGPYFNGRTTPPYSMTALFMDGDHLPFPFFTLVYHGGDGIGLNQFVDLNQDGKAEWIDHSYDEDVSDPNCGPFGSGHWVTQVYQFKSGGGAKRFRGLLGGMRFPFVKDWTEHCDGKSGLKLAVEPPYFPNDETVAETSNSPEPRVKISGVESVSVSPPVYGCNTIQPETLLYDRQGTREIAFPGFSSFWSSLLARVRSDGASVRLRGITKQGTNCRVALLWAEKRL